MSNASRADLSAAAALTGLAESELEQPVSAHTQTLHEPFVASALSSYLETMHASLAKIPEKLELARSFEPEHMTRVVAICHSGRSGSLLLASYFDQHPDTVTLPRLCGEHLYRFHSEHEALSVWERLLIFPSFSRVTNTEEGDFFEVIEAADYYASVLALRSVYGSQSQSWLGSGKRFFQLLHVAYAMATGRRPSNPRPMMVYAQHWVDQRLAELLVADFPDAKFVHAIRDPISSIDSWFDRQTELSMAACQGHPERAPFYLNPAASAFFCFLAWSRPHAGMESRSRAARFEDMHVALEDLMRDLSAWLQINYESCLLESTWNGKPYTVQNGSARWNGPNPANARRRSRNLNRFDRLLMYALLHENFSRWGYPSPSATRIMPVRLVLLAVFSWFPTRLEYLNAKMVLKLQARPALRISRVGFALRAPIFLLQRRVRIWVGVVVEAAARVLHRRVLLQRL